MIIDDKRDGEEQSQLFYDVMGIALAVWGSVGDGELFRFMDRALDDFDTDAMQRIVRAFGMLPQEIQDRLMAGEGSPQQLIADAQQLARHCHQIESVHARRLA